MAAPTLGNLSEVAAAAQRLLFFQPESGLGWFSFSRVFWSTCSFGWPGPANLRHARSFLGVFLYADHLRCHLLPRVDRQKDAGFLARRTEIQSRRDRDPLRQRCHDVHGPPKPGQRSNILTTVIASYASKRSPCHL